MPFSNKYLLHFNEKNQLFSFLTKLKQNLIELKTKQMYNGDTKTKERQNKMTNGEKEFLVHKIRTQYTEKASTELDELKRLDKRAKRPGKIFAYVFGVLAALIAGFGMSLVMTDIGDVLKIESNILWGVIIGLVGISMTAVCPLIHSRLILVGKRKNADKIVTLADKIMNNK